MAQVTLVNYGLGNIAAFDHIYRQLGVPVTIADNVADLASARRIILPGVGAFDWAMDKLNRSGLRGTLDELVLNRGVPVLGVCVGMQMMANRSEEGRRAGLGWLDAEVVRFRSADMSKPLALPHMGWNDVYPIGSPALLRDMERPQFYFLHSYYFVPHSPGCVAALTHYGLDFCSAITEGNVHGVQFHPEKSHGWGIQLLANFAGI